MCAAYHGEAVGTAEDGTPRQRGKMQPELIVSDVTMPRLDGFGLLKLLRAEKEFREIPFVLLSARAGEESSVEGLEVRVRFAFDVFWLVWLIVLRNNILYTPLVFLGALPPHHFRPCRLVPTTM